MVIATRSASRSVELLDLSTDYYNDKNNDPLLLDLQRCCTEDQQQQQQHRCSASRIALQQPPFIPQQKEWDCGLACVAMVLASLTAPTQPPPPLSSLQKLCGTTSVWSIDIAHLLRRFHVNVSYTTSFLGPNPAYQHEQFYADTLQHDIARVTALFQLAHSNGISIQKVSLTDAQLTCLVGMNTYLVIALVDKAKLVAAAKGGVNVHYTGHYILIYGFDPGTGDYLIRDPSSVDTHRMAAAELDAARRAYGTDEDLLFIHR